MKPPRFNRILFLGTALAVFLPVLAAPQANDEKEIRAVIEKNAAAWTKNDPALFAETLADTVVFTENGGLNDGRASVLDHVKHDHATMRSLTLTADVQRVHIAGNMAWVYALERARLEPQQGEPFTLKSHSIIVLEKVQGRWWIAAHSLSARRERP